MPDREGAPKAEKRDTSDTLDTFSTPLGKVTSSFIYGGEKVSNVCKVSHPLPVK